MSVGYHSDVRPPAAPGVPVLHLVANAQELADVRASLTIGSREPCLNVVEHTDVELEQIQTQVGELFANEFLTWFSSRSLDHVEVGVIVVDQHTLNLLKAHVDRVDLLNVSTLAEIIE